MNRVQRTLVEAWGLIRETFVDPTYNHQGISTELLLFNLLILDVMFRFE